MLRKLFVLFWEHLIFYFYFYFFEERRREKSQSLC